MLDGVRRGNANAWVVLANDVSPATNNVLLVSPSPSPALSIYVSLPIVLAIHRRNLYSSQVELQISPGDYPTPQQASAAAAAAAAAAVAAANAAEIAAQEASSGRGGGRSKQSHADMTADGEEETATPSQSVPKRQRTGPASHTGRATGEANGNNDHTASSSPHMLIAHSAGTGQSEKPSSSSHSGPLGGQPSYGDVEDPSAAAKAGERSWVAQAITRMAGTVWGSNDQSAMGKDGAGQGGSQ